MAVGYRPFTSETERGRTWTSPATEHELLREAVAELGGQFGHVLLRGLEDRGQDRRVVASGVGPWLPHREPAGGVRRRRQGVSELSIVCEEMAAQGCPLLLILVSSAICGELITRFGTAEQRQAWLPGLVAGEKMAFAITEPDAGSNSHNISTTATRDGDRWVLQGTKYYISGVDESDAVLVVARTGTDDDDRSRLGCRCSSSTPTRPASSARSSPWRSARPRSSSRCSSTTSRSAPTG